MLGAHGRTVSWWKVIFLILATLSSTQAATQNFQEEVPYGKSFLSPDGVTAAQLLADQDPVPLGQYTSFRMNALSIKDTRSGQVSMVYVDNPTWSFLGWTKDSKTIVTVEHVSTGNTVRFYDFDGTSWKPTEIGPPARLITHSRASALKTNLHSVTVTFLVEYEHPEHRAMAELHRYVVIVDGKTGEMKRRVSRQKIL